MEPYKVYNKLRGCNDWIDRITKVRFNMSLEQNENGEWVLTPTYNLPSDYSTTFKNMIFTMYDDNNNIYIQIRISNDIYKK